MGSFASAVALTPIQLAPLSAVSVALESTVTVRAGNLSRNSAFKSFNHFASIIVK
mgnify:CR=1 FL=1